MPRGGSKRPPSRGKEAERNRLKELTLQKRPPSCGKGGKAAGRAARALLIIETTEVTIG